MVYEEHGRHERHDNIEHECAQQSHVDLSRCASKHLAYGYLLAPLLNEIGAHGHQSEQRYDDGDGSKQRHDGRHAYGLTVHVAYGLVEVWYVGEVGHVVFECHLKQLIYLVVGFSLIAVHLHQYSPRPLNVLLDEQEHRMLRIHDAANVEIGKHAAHKQAFISHHDIFRVKRQSQFAQRLPVHKHAVLVVYMVVAQEV